MESTTEVIEAEQSRALVVLGDMPQTAGEIFTYVRDALVVKATPLKQESLGLHAHYSLLPQKWEIWGNEECEAAGQLYEMICKHEKAIDAEIGEVINKAFKLHRGMTAARTDIIAGIAGTDKNPGLKEVLMTSIRAWRKRETDRAAEEAERKQEEARKQEEDRRLQEALEREKEAEALRAAGHTVLAEEVQQEAAQLIDEPVFVPPPPSTVNIPKGGPKKQVYWKYNEAELDNVNSAAFKLLPDKFKIPNHKMIKATVNGQKDKTDIKGVKVWSE